jgi:hypothetical protein
MQRILLFFLLVFSIPALAQHLIKGVVLDEKQSPVQRASIFLSNTSVGTRTDDHGEFELSVPDGKFDLIVSCIGYETWNKTIVTSEIIASFTIRLKTKAAELETIVIEPYEKDGWEKWGRFFLENFIGTSGYATDCRIKNQDVIRFRFSKKDNELKAYASEPLIIENKALGYTITYQMETFSSNFKNYLLLFTGYPFFSPMKGSEAKQRRWEKKRAEVYYGSLMHFMRSVYRNKIEEEGFQIRALKKIPNTEKQRVRKQYAANQKVTRSATGTMVTSTVNQDSADYYNGILRQEDFIDVIAKNTLPGDSIAYAVDSTTAGMAFTDYLLVLYKNKIPPFEYRQRFPKTGGAMLSQITLINQRAIEINANGSYYNPEDLLDLGYWSWSEKMATMLPFDYKVKK